MVLLKILRKLKRKEKEMRLLLVGLDNGGKTTIVKRFNNEDIKTISPTLGFSINTLFYHGFRLNIWDVGGQETIRTYWRNYYEQTDGLIWVVDSSDKRRLRICRDELRKLLKEEKLIGSSLLIFANKQDLSGSVSVNEIATILDVENIKTHHCAVFGCSAVTGKGLANGINWLVDDIASRIYVFE